MNFQEFKDKFQYKEIEEYPNKVGANPLVSVCVMTYQHRPYIKECLDGILMQKTDFPFEILLGEDGSTDGTREICVAYAEKYPDKIRLFLHHRENNIKIDGHPTGRFNFVYNLFSARGEYIALCEGDDYWSDSKKLHKQISFLEHNQSYAATLHDAQIFSNKHNEYINKYSNTKLYSKIWANKSELVEKDFIKHWKSGPTASFVFKNDITDFPDWFFQIYGADTSIMILIGKYGRTKIFRECMSVYRAFNENSLEGRDRKAIFKTMKRRIKDQILLMNAFDNKYKKYFKIRMLNICITMVKHKIKSFI